jgi:hypothetical protein
MINSDFCRDAWHLTGYAPGVDPKTAYKLKINYIYHAIAIAVEDGKCFLYGMDDKLTLDQFTEIKGELRRMSFNEVGRHCNGQVYWEIL